jgi:hypothetical protein
MKKLIIALTLLGSMSSFAVIERDLLLDGSCKIVCTAIDIENNADSRVTRSNNEYIYQGYAMGSRKVIEQKARELGLDKCKKISTNFTKNFKGSSYEYKSSSCEFFKN